MTQARKYAALPDLDESQDVFETPDLTDDASTLQTSTARSPSPSRSETSDTEANSSISRSKLQPGQARSHFVSSRVDARETDFSDRLSGKRRAYLVSNRRRRHDDAEDDEDWDSEDETESLQRKVARLAREMQEVQSELDKRKETNTQINDDDVFTKMGQLSVALDGMRHSQSAHVRLNTKLSSKSKSTVQDEPIPAPEITAKEYSAETDTQALTKVADFDSRLALLERHLGITSLDTPQTSTSEPFTPILPTLSLLDRQLALLTSSASQPHIDNLAQRLQDAKAATNDTTEVSPLAPEDMAKLRSLYALLPTLNSLAPTLPPLLARLRSLRTLHANAATASQTLDEVERRQNEADKEIREWRDGLKKVQEAVSGAEGGMKENAAAVEGWVKDLEERVAKLG